MQGRLRGGHGRAARTIQATVGLAAGLAASGASLAGAPAAELVRPGLIGSQAAQEAPPLGIEGRVVDAVTGLPVAGVTVTATPESGPTAGTAVSAITGSDGRFRLEGLRVGGLGTVSLRASHVGYRERLRERVGLGGPGALTLRLVPRVHELEGLVIAPGAFSFLGAGGTTAMTREEIESAPQFGEDIFRAVNRLPGLSSSDYSAHFSIRGGRHDETLILLDGLEILEPYHLKDFNEGAISVVDADAIGGIELLTGGFPVRFGDRTGGVFRMTSRAPTDETAGYTIGASLMNARASGEGTFADGSGSWLVSARRGYLDLVFGLVKAADLPSPSYFDVFSSVRYDLSPTQALSVHALLAGDTYDFDAESTTGFQDTIPTVERARNRYGNGYAWARLESALGSRWTLTTLASAGRLTRDRDGAEVFSATSVPQYSVSTRTHYDFVGLKQDLGLALAGPVYLEAGYDLRSGRAEYRASTVVDQDPNDPEADTVSHFPVRTEASRDRSGTRVAAYLNARLRVAGPFVLEAGVRHDRTSYTPERDWSSRLGAHYALGSGTTLRFGLGQYRQSQSIHELSILDGQTDFFGSELSTQVTLGLEHRFPSGRTLRLETYRREGSELRPRYRNWKGGIDTFPESNEDRILVFPDSSTSKGFEAYFSGRVGRRTHLRAGYAYAVVDEVARRVDNINDATPIRFAPGLPGPQDQRHALNLDLTFRRGERWSLTAAYSFHSGWPTTPEEVRTVPTGNGGSNVAVRPLELYSDRLPSYHRADLRLTRRHPTRRGEMRLFFELTNVTNHSNVFGYDNYIGLDARGAPVLMTEPETWFPLLPSLGVTWRF